MNIKPLKKPLVLRKYESLLLRLLRKNTAIEQEYAKYKKGYEGEVMAGYYIRQLDHPGLTILQDVYIKSRGVQMDNLILSKRAIYIPEVKNYYGTVTFDTAFQQLIRHDGEKETGFKYPIAQVELQKHKLQQWLQDHGFGNIPIHPFIVISDPSTIIKAIGDQEEIAKVVIHGENLPRKIMEKERASVGDSQLEHRKIGYQILKQCSEFNIDIMADHGLTARDLIPGVMCPDCMRIGMARVHSGWFCQRCNKKYRNAHLKAIEDYMMLVKPSMTNLECRHWLKFNSKNTATRILKGTHLNFNKGLRRWEK